MPLLPSPKNSPINYDIYREIDENFVKCVQKKIKNSDQNIPDIISPIKISRYEKQSTYIYFALLVPEYSDDGNIVWKQTHAFLEKNYIFFVDEDRWHGFDILTGMKAKNGVHKKTESLNFFCEFVDTSVSRMFEILAKLQSRIETMEQTIFRNIPNNDQVSEIQNLKKNIINFRSVLVPLVEVFEDYLAENKETKQTLTAHETMKDILRKTKKLIANLDDFHDITKLLRETNETLIARSTNETVKRLTLFNALLLGPSLIAAFFGMNIHFGWFTENASEGQIAPLFGIICIMIFMTSCVYVFFRKRNWI